LNIKTKSINNQKLFGMKNLLIIMAIVSTVILSTLTSCTKEDSLPNRANGTTLQPVALNLTTYQWEQKGGGVFVNTFRNVIAPQNANYWAKIYLVAYGTDIPINRPIRFMDGTLWATSTQTDIAIFYRGNLANAGHLNIKVVFE